MTSSKPKQFFFYRKLAWKVFILKDLSGFADCEVIQQNVNKPPVIPDKHNLSNESKCIYICLGTVLITKTGFPVKTRYLTSETCLLKLSSQETVYSDSLMYSLFIQSTKGGSYSRFTETAHGHRLCFD